MELSEFAKANPARSSSKCWIERIPEEARAQVENASPEVAHLTISQWLKQEYDFAVTGQSIGRHRNRRCSCAESG